MVVYDRKHSTGLLVCRSQTDEKHQHVSRSDTGERNSQTVSSRLMTKPNSVRKARCLQAADRGSRVHIVIEG